MDTAESFFIYYWNHESIIENTYHSYQNLFKSCGDARQKRLRIPFLEASASVVQDSWLRLAWHQ